MSKISDFIKWLKNQIGSIYVWGAQGEVAFNEDWIRKMETNEKNAERAIAFYNKQKKSGIDPIAAYDCSGLIVRFFIDNKLISSDTTAAGLYKKCTAIKQSELKAGDLVFHHNGDKIHHVGVYIGDNMVIHAKGRDYGVVQEKFSTNDWNRFGRYEPLQEGDNKMAKIITKSSPLMKGEDIRKLQEAMNALGYDCGTADGIAGDKTIKAIQQFADKHTTVKLPESLTVSVQTGSKVYKGEVK